MSSYLNFTLFTFQNFTKALVRGHKALVREPVVNEVGKTQDQLTGQCFYYARKIVGVWALQMLIFVNLQPLND